MSASNSISQLLEQFLEMNTNSLETFNRINEAITTDKETVVINLFNSKTNKMETIQIPAFGYLKREIERLNTNLNSISGLEGSNANIRLKDGSFRTIHTARLKGPSPSITSLSAPTVFSTKLNEFFEDFLNPLLTVNLDVSGQIPVETEKVYVERFIFNETDLASTTAFDEIYKGGSEIDYAKFIVDLKDNGYTYIVDAEVLDMPIRLIQYTGFLDIIKIENAEKKYIIDGISQTLSVKLYTANKLTYTDSTKLLKDTETLKVGDSLIVNSGKYRTRYKVVSIENASSQIELLLIEGSEAVKLGINQLGIYKDVDTNLDIEIKVGFNERQVIFVKPIDPSSKIPAEHYSPGISFYSNELEITDMFGTKMNLAEYYKNEVSDFSQFIKSLKVDYIPPAAIGIIPNKPVIATTNFKVVQVNKHLTDNTTTDKIKQLKSDKVSIEQSLKKLDDSIKQKKSLINTKKFTSDAERDTHKNELNSLILQRDSETKLFSSIVTEIKSSAESIDLQSVTPKYRVRGFWSIPEPKAILGGISQKIVQFKIRYRYISASGKTSTVDQIPFTDVTNQVEKTAAFSNWIEVLGPVAKRELSIKEKYEWIIESEEDANAVNFNSMDISINPGESVEFMIKSISEAGYPANPLESKWSDLYTIPFPLGEINTDTLGNVINSNEMDALRVQIQQDLESAGVYSHVSESFAIGDSKYSHSASSIASGFLTSQQSPVTVYEKLLALQNEVLSLRALIENTTGELLVRIVDESGNVTPVTNNTTVQLFAGYYVNEIPATNGKGFIVTKNFKIELTNTQATNLELISRIVGDTTKPVAISSGSTIFGLGTGASSIDPNYVYNSYYINEAKYDMVPVIYQNIENSTLDYFNNGPDQSTQLNGQFIYSRFRNIANDDNLYVINEGVNGDVNSADLKGYDTYEYSLKFNYSRVITVNAQTVTSFAAQYQSVLPYTASTGTEDFIWAGSYTGSTPNTTSLSTITQANYTNGIFMHVDHPLLQNGAIDPLSIVSNGLVGMPKTAPLRADDLHGKKQTPFRLLQTLSSTGVVGVRSTIKNGFSADDQYLLGGRSCGSFLYVSPLTTTSLSVDAGNKNGKKILPGGSANSVSIDLVFQYRMTDYFGKSDGIGRVGGVTSNTFSNITYAKKIGLDILNKNGEDFLFDVEVYAKYATQGKNVNSITSTMLSNYTQNYTTGTKGRRRYLTDNTVDFSYPEITKQV